MATYYIVEGPDGAGKTTLVEKLLAVHPDASLAHFGKPATDEEAFNYWKVYMQYIKDHEKDRVVILDRGWYSDMVYGPVMRDREEMTIDNMELLEMAVKACGGGVIIYCTGRPDILWRRCKTRGEDYIHTTEQLRRLHDKYEDVMKLPKYLPVIRTDTTARW